MKVERRPRHGEMVQGSMAGVMHSDCICNQGIQKKFDIAPFTDELRLHGSIFAPVPTLPAKLVNHHEVPESGRDGARCNADLTRFHTGMNLVGVHPRNAHDRAKTLTEWENVKR